MGCAVFNSTVNKIHVFRLNSLNAVSALKIIRFEKIKHQHNIRKYQSTYTITPESNLLVQMSPCARHSPRVCFKFVI